jgi:tetratricopeptide (TPR) repeat protein
LAKKRKDHRDVIEKAGDLMERSLCDSSFRLYGELRHRAKAESSLFYYVIGTFFQMNLAHRQFQFDLVRERAIELIAIFENEEQARKIESELDLEQYEGLRYHMGACAYEVLAEATGELEGFNSEGMQECLTGGIDVCHRLGKLSCIGCFREYACDVHRAADDFELARFHCNQVLKHSEDFSERGDRRWLATMKLGVMDVFEGEHELARQKFEKAWELAQGEAVNDHLSAMASIAFELHNLDVLESREVDPKVVELLKQLPPRGECVEYDYHVDCATALLLAHSREWDQAEQILSKWHRFSKQQKAMSLWIETGIRIAACKRLRGDIESAKRIASPLESAATKANDWNSLKRLSLVLDSSYDVTPLGTIVRNSQLHPGDNTSIDRQIMAEQDRPVYHKLSTDTPLFPWLEDLSKRLQVAQEGNPVDMDLDAFRSELLVSQNRDWSHPEDIGRALHFMVYMVTPGCDFRAVWEWANKLVSGFQETGYLVSILARLGMSISAAERFEQLTQIDLENFDGQLPPPLIENERLDQLVRKSLQLDSSGVNNNFRAGEVFEYIDNLGEAERCYARAFKLDRSRVDAAMSLARIYSNSDRNSDAHYVLDLCIREGGDAPDLYFEAAMRAHSLSMHELQVSYLKTLLEKYDPIPWSYYYLAIGLLELKKPKEALEMIQLEQSEFQGEGIHIESILAEAHVLIGSVEQAKKAVRRSLQIKLSETDDLTTGGIASAMERLWRASKLTENKELRRDVEKRLLECGMAPESYFEELRSAKKPKDLDLFHVALMQPLKEDWSEFPGCLPDQTDWTSYIAHWGVLASDEDEAINMASEMQRMCYDLDPEVIDVSSSEEPLHDRPGIAFQGFRTSDDDMDDDLDMNDEMPF